MGDNSYSFSSRSLRAETNAYFKTDLSNVKSVNTVFTQNLKKEINQSMNPKGIIVREARDSKTNPNTIPIVLALDVTGSMLGIPVWLVREGLPKLMEKMLQKGIGDPSLLFMAIGDTYTDNYPLQVGQFESGDEQLDNWLTSTYLEKGGGANEGESYSLAWYFAANHTATDAWEKRKHKGILFTTGDEPCLEILPKKSVEELMGNTAQDDFTVKDLLKAAQEKWNVYHLHIMEGSRGVNSLPYWKTLLGDHCIQVDDHKQLADIMGNIVYENFKNENLKSSFNTLDANDTGIPITNKDHLKNPILNGDNIIL